MAKTLRALGKHSVLPDGDFVEIHVNAPRVEAGRKLGELANFTRIDSACEPPEGPRDPHRPHWDTPEGAA